MDIHLIGANGFIGKSIQKINNKFNIVPWSHQSKEKKYFLDLYKEDSWERFFLTKPKKVILLSWPGLPNYMETFHLTKNLFYSIKFIEKLVELNVEKIVVAGTCFEYGNINGCLEESIMTNPTSLYGIAKDSLRKTAFSIIEGTSTKLCWIRIFYPFGEGQNPNSLIPSLVRAIKNKEKYFNLSSGRQIRDFINVKDLANNFLQIIDSPKSNGIYNCGSGNPLSISEFVKNKVEELNSDISLNFGSMPDRQDEPIAFWANMNKFKELL